MVQVSSAPEQAARLGASAEALSAGRISFRAQRQFLTRLLQVRGAKLGLGVLVVLVFMALTAQWISPKSPIEQVLLDTLQAPPWWPFPVRAGTQYANWSHVFGTDDLGRDVLSRVIYGSRVSLQV